MELFDAEFRRVIVMNQCKTCRYWMDNKETDRNVKEWFANDGNTKITVIVEQYGKGMCVYNGLKTSTVDTGGNVMCSAYGFRGDVK